MSTVSNRIKELRKENHLSQAKFGEKIGISRDAVNNIEQDRNKKGVPDNIIKLIAVTFNVNESWLRTGNGTKPNQSERKDEITKAVKSLLTSEKDSFKERLISVLVRLDESQWEVLADIAEKITINKPDNNTDNEISATEEESKEFPPEYENMSVEEIEKQADFWDSLYEKRQAQIELQEQEENTETKDQRNDKVS